MADPLPFVQVPTVVVRDAGLTIAARLLYAVVGTYADLTTREATLLRSTLAKDIGRSRDTVDRAVAELVKAGLMHVSHRRNDKGVLVASTYRLISRVDAFPQVAGGRTDAHTPDAGEPGGVGTVADTGVGTGAGMGTGAHTPMGMGADTVGAPVRPGYGHGCGKELEPINENQGTREERPAAQAPPLSLIPEPPIDTAPQPTFADFWAAYPLRKGKGDAEKAWAKAIKRAKPSDIVAAIATYKKELARTRAYCKYPATWLNQDCWDDEPTPEELVAPQRPSGRSTSNDAVAKAQSHKRHTEPEQIALEA